MSLKSQHEAFLAYTIESKDHHGEDIAFDVSDEDLQWFDDKVGTPAEETFVLVGGANIVSQEDDGERAMAGVTTMRSNVTVRLSTMLAKCGGVPAAGTQITVVTPQGARPFVVEYGQTRVDYQLGRVHYYLTDVEAVA